MVEVETHKPMPETTYPALKVSTLVIRRPIYFYANVIVPMASLTFLALLQFQLPGERGGTNVTFRITYTVTILLTTATYKLFIASALPIGLAYLTLLDKYVLFCYLLQVALVTETAINGAAVMTSEDPNEGGYEWLPQWSTSRSDFVLAWVCAAVFIGGHIWFFFCLHVALTRTLSEQLERYNKEYEDVDSSQQSGSFNASKDADAQKAHTYRTESLVPKPMGALSLVSSTTVKHNDTKNAFEGMDGISLMAAP